MKIKKIGLSIALLFTVVLSTGLNSASAAGGTFDPILSRTFSSDVPVGFRSGGGDLKICVTSTTSQVKFGLAKYLHGAIERTTSGGSSNCAIWRDIPGSGKYTMYTVTKTSVRATIYD